MKKEEVILLFIILFAFVVTSTTVTIKIYSDFKLLEKICNMKNGKIFNRRCFIKEGDEIFKYSLGNLKEEEFKMNNF